MSDFTPDRELDLAATYYFKVNMDDPAPENVLQEYRNRLLDLSEQRNTKETLSLAQVSQLLAKSQRYRRNVFLSHHPDTASKEPVVTLQIQQRSLLRYRDGIASELKLLRDRRSPTLVSILEEEILYVDDCVACIQDALRGKGEGQPSTIEALLKPITTKIELKIALKLKFDQLKADTPAELLPDLERAFRHAVEQLDKQ